MCRVGSPSCVSARKRRWEQCFPDPEFGAPGHSLPAKLRPTPSWVEGQDTVPTHAFRKKQGEQREEERAEAPFKCGGPLSVGWWLCSQSETEAPEPLELLTPKVNRVGHEGHKERA